jgi:hypothetical protein
MAAAAASPATDLVMVAQFRTITARHTSPDRI